MENLKGKTAFITGGASGIGFGIATAAAQEGMNVAVIDVRQTAIDEAVAKLKAEGHSVAGFQLDVTDREAYQKVVDAVIATFGNIHLLCNNAGIGCAGGPLWSVSFDETDLAINVNLKGVLNGIRVIVPHMLEHGEGGHVVSTASKAGLLPVPGCALYNLTKMGVVGTMESLFMDLEGTTVGASAFCPGGFNTNLGMSSQFVTEKHLGKKEPEGDAAPPPPPPSDFKMPDYWDELIRSPLDAGKRVIRGVKRGDLYILTHSEFKPGIERKAGAILRALPDEVPNPKYGETFYLLTDNPIFDKQTQVPALEK